MCNVELDVVRIEFAPEEVPALVKRIAELEAQQAVLGKALEKLAKLGNGARYGNSEGNMIAIAALAAVKSVAMFNGMTEAETNTTASVAGLAARKTCAARGFMFGNDGACSLYCVGGGCGSDEPCEHQLPAGQEGGDRV